MEAKAIHPRSDRLRDLARYGAWPMLLVVSVIIVRKAVFAGIPDVVVVW